MYCTKGGVNMNVLTKKSKENLGIKTFHKNKSTTARALLIVAMLLMSFNAFQISAMQDMSSMDMGSSSSKLNTLSKQAKSDIIPTGVPKVWGKELDFSYDDIDPYNPASANAAITTLGNLDRTITLPSDLVERYVSILFKNNGGMSCEFCCGAKSIIFENGSPACGCAHSFAMRGITKYLLINHPDMSDEEILTDVGKLKVLFFPGIHESKAAVMESKGIDVNIISLTTNENRGIEKGQTSGGSMVGGC